MSRLIKSLFAVNLISLALIVIFFGCAYIVGLTPTDAVHCAIEEVNQVSAGKDIMQAKCSALQ